MGVCEPGFFLKHYPVDNNVSYPYDRCKPCEPGSYNFYRNMTFCHNCPLNAMCELDNVESMSGYWSAIDKHGRAYTYSCNNDFCAGSNECLGNRDPKLPICGACKPGYANWGNKCLECSKSNVNALGLILFMAYLLVMFIFNHVSSQSPASNSASKLLFFFAQTLTLMVPSSQFIQWTKSVFNFNFSALFVGKSSSNKGSAILKCPFARNGYYILLTNVLEQFSFFVMLFLTFLICCFINLMVACVRQRRRRWRSGASTRTGVTTNAPVDIDERSLDDSEYSECTNRITTNDEEQREQRKDEHDAMDGDKTVEADDDTSNHNDEYSSSRSSRIKSKIAHVSVQAYRTSKQQLSGMFLRPSAYVLSLIQILIITYQGITQATVSFFACKWFGNSYHAVFSTDIICFSSPQYRRWMPLYIILLIYSILFPFALIAFMVWNRRRLYQETFASMFGSVYMNYKPKYYWWEGVALLRRTIIIGMFSGVELLLDVQFHQYGIDSVSGKMKYVMMGALFSVFFLMHRFTNPYARKVDNSMEEVSYVSLAIIAWITSVKGYLDTLDVRNVAQQPQPQPQSEHNQLSRMNTVIGVLTMVMSMPPLALMTLNFVLSNGLVQMVLQTLKQQSQRLRNKLFTNRYVHGNGKWPSQQQQHRDDNNDSNDSHYSVQLSSVHIHSVNNDLRNPLLSNSHLDFD